MSTFRHSLIIIVKRELGPLADRKALEEALANRLNTDGGMYSPAVIALLVEDIIGKKAQGEKEPAIVGKLVDALLQYMDSKPKRPPKQKVNWYPAAQALAEVCFMPFEKNQGLLLGEAKRLGEHPDDIRKYYSPGGWWYTTEDPAEKWHTDGRHPIPSWVRQTWGRWNPDTFRPKGKLASAGPAKKNEFGGFLE